MVGEYCGPAVIPVVGAAGAAPVGASAAGNMLGVAAAWLACVCDVVPGRATPTGAGEAPEGPACCVWSCPAPKPDCPRTGIG